MGLIYALGALGAALLGFAVMGRRPGRSGGDTMPGSDGPETPPSPPPPSSEGEGDRPDRDRGEGEAPPVPLAPTPPGPTPTPASPTMDQWAAAMAAGCLAHGIPLPYAIRWLLIESGGKPCACGRPDMKGPDGYPREMGIAQLYNPDDLSVVTPALTGAELRAYCVPGDWHPIMYKKKVIKGFSQDLLRPLTPAEIQRQADGAVGLIARSDRITAAQLGAVNASGPAWSRTQRGYWALVKMQHGYPVLASHGLPAVARILGRAPRDWREFVATLPRAQPGYAAIIPVIVSNAERCASAVPEPRVA